MKAVVLAGGDVVVTPYLLELLEGSRLVIAADSGLRHAEPLGLAPALVVGDFDSVTKEVLASFPDLPRHQHPVDKDRLDLELAIDMALERGAEELLVLGAFGSRFDQSLAALLICARLSRAGVRISLHDGARDGYVVPGGSALSLELPDATVFSLLALEESRCSVDGAEYRLDDVRLPFGVGLGVANRARGGPRLEVRTGLVALLVERSLE